MKKEKLKITIQTFGCQMNAYDTEVASGILNHHGYQVVHEFDALDKPAERQEDPRRRPLWMNADIILMNTCSVREHAEDVGYVGGSCSLNQ